MIAAVAGALGISLINLTEQAAAELRRRELAAQTDAREVGAPSSSVLGGPTPGAGPVVLALAA